ncbi:MAG: NAD kinase [Actinomycetota bacterium]|nr:NAD kinase [Actinomycetota bacterium]
MTPDREVLLVAHTGRAAALRSARLVIAQLASEGIGVRVLEGEAAELVYTDATVVPSGAEATENVELVMVLGGDGTLLRAAELARPTRVPVLGVNLGQVGFLAEAEREDLTETVERVVARDYDVEERMTLDVSVLVNGDPVAAEWALNEASVEKPHPVRLLEVIVDVDGRPLSRYGCDGVVCATPTGSTAYAFSGGGPVVWPEVQALLLVPISAHALFSRPLVISPSSVVGIEILTASPGAVLWCDGRRRIALPSGSRVEVRRGTSPVRLARLRHRPFTDRLVAKFGLPVQGWRGRTK